MSVGRRAEARASWGVFPWGFRRTAAATRAGDEGRWGLPAVLGAGLVLRLALASSTRGYPADIGTFSAWAAHAAEGLTSFYSPGYFADYPPGYIYVLWAIGKLRALLGLGFDTPAFLVLLKLPAILSDLGTAWLLGRLSRPRAGAVGAAALAAFYALNPAVVLDSAVWGQVDGVLTLFLLLGVLLLDEHPAGSGASFAAALLVKPQALVFAPLPALWLAARLLGRDRRARGDILAFVGAAVAVFCLAVLPFAAREDLGWIVARYRGTLESYPFATLNAFNLFALTGGNLAPTAERLLGVPYSAWGAIFIVLIVAYSAFVVLRGRGQTRLWYVALFLPAAVFVLSAKMHERYLFPALAMALGYYAASRNRRALWLYAGFSATAFLNVAEVLALSHRGVYGVPPRDPLLLAVSLANVLLLGALAAAGWRRHLRGSPLAGGEPS